MTDKIITQIGSLPYNDVKQAVEYSLEHDIPFLPELPQRGDAILEYIKNPGKMSCLEEFKKHSFETVKVQCVGPATLVMAGYSEGEATERIYEHISKILDGLMAEQTILFLDEPALGQIGLDFEELWLPIFSSFQATPGVHCCGNMDWDILFKSELIKIISFDASQFDITKYPGYRGDKKIAWGVKKLEDIKDFREGDLLTLPCGMGTKLYAIDDCQKELERLKIIANKIHR